MKRLSSRAGRFALWKFIALAASGNCREASELLGRYLKAGEGRDLDSLVSLLEEGHHLHHAAFAAMVCGARRDARLFDSASACKPYGGFRLVATGRQPATGFCCLFPCEGGRTLGSPLYPCAVA